MFVRSPLNALLFNSNTSLAFDSTTSKHPNLLPSHLSIAHPASTFYMFTPQPPQTPNDTPLPPSITPLPRSCTYPPSHCHRSTPKMQNVPSAQTQPTRALSHPSLPQLFLSSTPFRSAYIFSPLNLHINPARCLTTSPLSISTALPFVPAMYGTSRGAAK